MGSADASSPSQGVPVLGMRDLDQRPRPLLVGAAGEARDTVFGDHVVDVVARTRDDGAFSERAYDARVLAAAGGGLDRDDAKRIVDEPGAAEEVELPADARHLLAADRLGVDLAAQVYRDGAVDAPQPAVEGDLSRVEYLVRAAHGRGAVPVDEREDRGVDRGDRRNGEATVDALLRVVGEAAGDQRHEAGAEHLGVDPEAATVEQRDSGVGHRADAHLQRGAVGHQLAQVARDDRRVRRGRHRCVHGCGARRKAGPRDGADRHLAP